jgi:Uncharacterized protein containing LysM domain
MERKFIIKDTSKNTEMVLPVTPPSFEVSHGINVETINIHTVGDVVLPGYSTLAAIKIDCMFPAKIYPFCQPGTNTDPYSYLDKILSWKDKHTILRYVVANTRVNLQVIITDISYGERDGTNDVYATISMREYRVLSVVQTNKTGNKTRVTEKDKSDIKSYVVKDNDTMSSICRKQYGNTNLYSKLAKYNGIKNPNLIVKGQVLKIPDKNLL